MSEAEIRSIAEMVADILEKRQQLTQKGLWSLPDVADYLGMSETAIRHRVYAGTFPPPDMGGGRGSPMRWLPGTIEDYLRRIKR